MVTKIFCWVSAVLFSYVMSANAALPVVDSIDPSVAPYVRVTHSATGCKVVSLDPKLALVRAGQPDPVGYARLSKVWCLGDCNADGTALEGTGIGEKKCGWVAGSDSSHVSCEGCTSCKVSISGVMTVKAPAVPVQRQK